MGYYTEEGLMKLGFKSVGVNVKISDKASIYNQDKIIIGNNSRIDDFCVISGKVIIGEYVHVTPMCLLAGGTIGIEIDDYSTFAYGVKVFTKSDDYTGEYMANSLVPHRLKKVTEARVKIGRHCIVGANSIIFPGVSLNVGASIGAMTLVVADVDAWSINVGIPSKKIKNRLMNPLQLEKEL